MFTTDFSVMSDPIDVGGLGGDFGMLGSNLIQRVKNDAEKLYGDFSNVLNILGQ